MSSMRRPRSTDRRDGARFDGARRDGACRDGVPPGVACRRLFQALTVGGLALALAGPMAAPAAAAEGLKVRYDVYLGGIHGLDAEFTLRRTNGRYAFESVSRTHGIWSYLFRWESRSMGEGRLEGTRLVPEMHRARSTGGGEPRGLDITYDADGSVASVVIEPKIEETDRVPIPADLIRGTTDATTGLMQALSLMPPGGTCGGTIPVYDGRRRFDVRLEPAGVKDLAANKYSTFAGPASVCRLLFRSVAGGRTPERTMFWRAVDKDGNAGFPTTVFLAPVGPGGETMPVRVEVDSPFGWAIVHIRGVEAMRSTAALP
jgi:hypothetical protein